MNQNFIEDNLIIISKQTIDVFLQNKNFPNLFGLYGFYYYTAKWQKTNQPKASTAYTAKGMHWAETKVIKNKKELIRLGLIEDIIQKNEKTGKITGWFIKINYIWKKENIPPSPPCGFPQGVETGGTNALSAGNLNALSANKKICEKQVFALSSSFFVSIEEFFQKEFNKKFGFEPVITYAKGIALIRSRTTAALKNGGAWPPTPEQLAGAEQRVKEVIAFFLTTEKAEKYPSISAALSADTINQFKFSKK